MTAGQTPTTLPDAIAELAEHPNWVCWRYETREGKPTKVPYQATGPKADSTRATTWTTYQRAHDAAPDFDGLGFVVTDTPYCGVDLDHCVDRQSGAVAPWAQQIVDALGSYTEETPSQEGLRVWIKGRLPVPARHKFPQGPPHTHGAVELYDTGRFFTVTGQQWLGTPATIAERQVALDALYARLQTEREPAGPPVESNGHVPSGGLDLADAELLERAHRAKNGDAFARLWKGDWQGAGYSSQSEADLALCAHLAFWAGRNRAQMDRLVRQSGLMREKWDERRGAGTYGTVTTERALARCDAVYSPSQVVPRSTEPRTSEVWPDPMPVPKDLPPVPPFEPARLLPAAFTLWIVDIAERAQCPVDFVAIAAVVAAGAVVGRRLAIRPKQYDDWTVVPNLWGLAIGRPGIMKSPALREALRPLHRLVAEAREAHRAQMQAHVFNQTTAKIQKELLQREIKEALKRGDDVDAQRAKFDALELAPPTEHRYLVNDSTVEKLGELLDQNPNGLLLFRDELVGWLRTMDREGHENDRAFFCECWNGTGSYTYDRIGRGTVHIEAACISLLGGMQPGPLRAYLRDVFGRGATDDGLIQRFQLMVYPDVTADWRNVDRCPDTEAKTTAFEIYRRLAQLDPVELAGHRETPDSLPFLRFTPEAQAIFDTWRTDLEACLLAETEHPVVVSHLAKYRSLMPALALLFHAVECVDRGQGGAVSDVATTQAVAWCSYLEAHARRVYEYVTAGSKVAAAQLAAKITAGQLAGPFRVRTVRLKGWMGLSELEEITNGLDLLEELHWVRRVQIPATSRGGRPTVEYHVNPGVIRKKPK